jgi:hypothetical protein
MNDETTELPQDGFEEPTPTPPYDADRGPQRSWGAGRHPVNVLHLVFGVAFVGLVVNWALIQSDTVDGSGLRWLLPIPWVAAGAAGLIAAAPRLRGTRE